jgi:HJR/Mrr/RecB family endonuclease
MAGFVNVMVHNDVTCQWLMGNELKVDQIKFLYDVIKVIYESPCREKLLKKDPEILNVTIPMMTVFKTLIHMRDWINNKEEYEEKMKKLAIPEDPVPQPDPVVIPTSPGKR